MAIDAETALTANYDSRTDHLYRLRARFATRTSKIEIINTVREGRIRDLFPAELSWDDEFIGTPAANFIDNVAHDLVEGIAPLPSLRCTSGKMTTNTDRERAARKNHIGANYWLHSKLQTKMYSIADQYATAGFVAMYVYPDLDDKYTCIDYDESLHTYYELDREGDTVHYVHVEKRSVDELCAEFPEVAWRIREKDDSRGTEEGHVNLDVAKWIDKTNVTLFLPERGGLILTQYPHMLSRHPVRIVERPGFGRRNPRGQYDDVVWVQVSRAIMGILSLKAAAKAVEAPIALPDDVDELPIGPDATIQSKDAKDIHRVSLELPTAIFAETSVLDNELRLSARYPDARTGESTASVIIGKGVEALLGTFDSQIRGAQMIFQQALEYITSICFEMDEVWWPNNDQTVRGNTVSGSFEFTYYPRSFAGRWDTTVTYGFMTGLKPAQAIVSSLQLAGAGLIAKKTAVTNLPFEIDATQEEIAVNTEGAREALKQGLFALIQSSGQIASQGGDALSIITLGVDAIHNMENGETVEDAIEDAYKKMAEAQAQKAAEAAQQAQEQAAGAPAGVGGQPGGLQNPLPQGVAPGQAGMPPGGRPSIESLISGFRGTGATPVMSATTQQKLPTGQP